MVIIRLKKLKNKGFNIVKTDSRKNNSRKLEKLGYYNSLSKKLSVNKFLLRFYIKKGAVLTNTVLKILKNEKIFNK